MREQITASQALGLTLCGQSLKGALLSQAKGRIHLEHFFEMKDDFSALQNEDVKPLYIPEIVKLQEEASHLLVATGLKTQDLLIRPLEIKLTKERDIEAVFSFQCETLLPYSLENAVLDKIQLSKDDHATQFTMLSIRKDYLQDHLHIWAKLSLEPEVVSASPVALATFSHGLDPRDNRDAPLFTFHMGLEALTCVLAVHGKLLAAHSSPLGFQSLIEAFAKDKTLPLEEAESLLIGFNFSFLQKEETPALYEAVHLMTQALLKTSYALCKYAKGQRVDEVMVTGVGFSIESLAKCLCDGLNKTVLIPVESEWKATSAQLQIYAVPIGLAMTALPAVKEQVNFRQQEFSYPNPWKRYTKLAAAYVGLCCTAGLSLFLFGKAWLGYQEDQLKEKYVQVLTVLNKSHPSVEADYAVKNLGYQEDEPLSLKKFTRQDLRNRLQFIEKELQATPDIFPLQPNVPRVSDVLAWLSTHANMAINEGETWQPLVQIENFNYTLVKRPELNKKQEKYQVKVELEFTSPTPKQAREFHDALIAPNDFVDPKGDIKWSASRGKYRTSFFLKDKTTYPAAL